MPNYGNLDPNEYVGWPEIKKEQLKQSQTAAVMRTPHGDIPAVQEWNISDENMINAFTLLSIPDKDLGRILQSNKNYRFYTGDGSDLAAKYTPEMAAKEHKKMIRYFLEWAKEQRRP